MIKSILVATDGSDHAWSAWSYAVELAKAFHALIRVLAVVDARALQDRMAVPAGGLDPLNLDANHALQLSVRLEAELGQMLSSVQRLTEEAGVSVEPTMARGAPAEQIAAYDGMVDLIALGHSGDRSPWDRLMMGSVAEFVVRRSATPVLVAPERHTPLKKLLAAYDGSGPSKRALQWAAETAATLRVPLDVVHVSRNEPLAQLTLSEARDYLKPYGLVGRHTILRHGKPALQILETAQEYGDDLIVMGAHGHPRLRQALLGSVTETVLQKSRTPLLLTR